MSKSFNSQAEEFHNQVVELIKKYQFRDRNQLLKFDLSISQSYVLEVLNRDKELSMKELAHKMHLSISAITRVVDVLVKKKYVNRTEDSADRRIKLLTLTPAGRRIYAQCWDGVFASEKAILEQVDADQREAVIKVLKELNRAVDSWRNGCPTWKNGVFFWNNSW